MASGSFTGSKYGRNSNYYIVANYSSAPSTANNNSALTVNGTLYRNAMYLGSRTCTIYVTYTDLAGKAQTMSYPVTVAAVSSGSAASYQLIGHTFTVPHKANGMQSITIKIDYNTKDLSLTGYGTVADIVAEKSGIALDTIPRESSISSISGNTIGSKITCNISRASTAFTHKVWFKKPNGTRIQIATAATDSAAYTPEMTDCSLITNSDHATASFIIQTYNGTTAVGGEVEKSFTLYVPASVVPVVNSVATEVVNDNATVSGWGICLKGFSKIKVTPAVTTAYGSAINAYSITGGVFTGTTNPYTTGLLKTAGSVTFACIVTDKRGRPSVSKNSSAVTVTDYSPPYMTSVPTWFRCNASGVADDSGQYLRVLVNSSFSSCGGHNARTIKMYSKLTNASSYTLLTTLTNGTAQTVGGNFLTGSSYNIMFEVIDSLGEKATYIDVVPTESVAFNLRAGGNGGAFGQVAEEDDVLSMSWGLKAASGAFAVAQNGAVSAPSAEIAGRTSSKSVQVKGDSTGGVLFPSPLDANRYWWFFNYIVNGVDYNKIAFRCVNKIGDTSHYIDYMLKGLAPDETGYQTCEILTQKNTSDYIVEKGTSGIWTYEKYNSGFARCYGAQSDTVSCTTAWGAVYINSGFNTYSNLPSGLFVGVSGESLTIDSVNASVTTVSMSTFNLTTEHTSAVQFIRGTSAANIPVTLYWEVRGRWK